MGLLSIEKAKDLMRFKTDKFMGYRISKDRNSVIEVGDTMIFEIVFPPKQIVTPLKNGRKATSNIMTIVLLEIDGKDTYKDNESIKVLITNKDSDYINNKLKAKSGDRISATGKMYTNKYNRKNYRTTSWFDLKNKTAKAEDIVYDDPNTELVSNKKEKIIL